MLRFSYSANAINKIGMIKFVDIVPVSSNIKPKAVTKVTNDIITNRLII